MFYQEKDYLDSSKLEEFHRSLVLFMKPIGFAEYLVDLASKYSVDNKSPPSVARPKLKILRATFSRSSRSWLGAILGLLDPQENNITSRVWA